MGVPVLEELRTWKRQPQKFSERARLLFFLLAPRFFLRVRRVRWLSERKGEKEGGEKRGRE